MSIGVTEDHEALAASVRGWAERAGLREGARTAFETAQERPAWWSAFAGQGLLGLHVPEELGGSGGGGVELAVTVEELGRAVAQGPALPTLLTSLVLSQVGGTPAKELLPSLTDGTSTGAVALSDQLTATTTDEGITVSGTVSDVLGGALADVLVLGAGDTWFAVDAALVTVVEQSGLDGARRPATVTLAEVVVPGSRVLPGLTLAGVQSLAGVLAAAEACGIAGWCLDTAAAYATTREQFGKKIGAFQGVKHKCAEMLVRAEQAYAVVWDAARALDEAPSAERDLSSAIAISVAINAAVENAKDCIQVLGGIGYTWEHDAHLFLKRALALRAWVGAPSTWRGRACDLALEGTRRSLELDLGDSTALREEVRAFVATLPDDPKQRRITIADAGFQTPHWPAPWGRNASAVEQLVIDQEFAAAGVQRADLVIGGWAAPTIVAHGTSEQAERFVRPTLHGDIVWCQLFSEPGAGSDLSGLTTRAEKVEGGWKVNGQKVWTSVAHFADWGILLARTSGNGKGPDRSKGITYFLLDMKCPGVDIRPLRELTGHNNFNEVFLDDVFVPDELVVGPVDGGWKLARTTLANERVAMSGGSRFGKGVESLLKDVLAVGAPDPLLRDKVGHLVAEAFGQSMLAFRTTLRQLSGAEPGSASSVRKLVGMRHQQDVAELRFELRGTQGVSRDGELDQLAQDMLQTRCLTIAGGTSEVLKNVVAERILGLPRDL
jgi:alkylation response protein AidB-like acyl-CoA dehydrogenase